MARDPIHPGKFLADELAELGMSATALAHILHVPPNHISQILRGKRALTADTALRLSQWLGTSPDLWINLQKLYELRLAERRGNQAHGAALAVFRGCSEPDGVVVTVQLVEAHHR